MNKYPTSIDLSCPVPRTEKDRILLAHGSGGALMRDLLRESVVSAFDNPLLAPLHDGALVGVDGARLAFTTDAYVVDPLVFPGGSIAELAVNGTVNDLAMCGARPLFLSVAFVIEEGMERTDFERIVRAMRVAADAAGVAIVTGDTKVVERGRGDGVYITTAGIGRVIDGIAIDPRSARPGDRVLINGDIARHGIAVMAARERLAFQSPIPSDTAPLHAMVEAVLGRCPHVRVLRDPTRGGVSATLNEIASSSHVGIEVDERRIPVREEVAAACEILGFDPLQVANEGKLIAIVPPTEADAALEVMRAFPVGQEAAEIGEVTEEHPDLVVLRTSIGGRRVVDMLSGEQLPRIC